MMKSDDLEFIQNVQDWIKYIAEFGDKDKANQLEAEYQSIAENGAPDTEFYRFKRKVIYAKHKAERLIA